MDATSFQVSEYMGRWYELLHYPTFFQGNDNYNTMATYTLQENGTIEVLNTTITGNGEEMTTKGIAHQISSKEFRVDFLPSDVAKFIRGGAKAGGGMRPPPQTDEPNYIIRRIFTDKDGKYSFAVVTDANADSVWLLSREQFPSRRDYARVMKYVNHHYDRSKFILTPHYK